MGRASLQRGKASSRGEFMDALRPRCRLGPVTSSPQRNLASRYPTASGSIDRRFWRNLRGPSPSAVWGGEPAPPEGLEK